MYNHFRHDKLITGIPRDCILLSEKAEIKNYKQIYKTQGCQPFKMQMCEIWLKLERSKENASK